MKTLATYFRGLQLFAHNAHNLSKGSTFFEDHEFFGSLYATYESAYDSIVERMIGLEEEIDLKKITKDACDVACAKDPKTNEEFLKIILATEKVICSVITQELPNLTEGSKNLLQDLADQSEARQYKLRQRLK